MNLLNDVLTYIRRIIKFPSNMTITDNLLIDYVNRFYIMDVSARIQLFDLKTKYQFQTTPGVDQYNMPLYSFQSETPGSGAIPTGSAASNDISFYPVYQGFTSPCYINGIQVPLQTQKNTFFDNWPNIVQNANVVGIGNGTAGPYTLQLPILPPNPVPTNPPLQGILRGHVDITGVMSTGVNVDPPLVSSAQIVANDPFIQDMPVTSVEARYFLTATNTDGSNIVVTDSGQFLQGNQNYGLLMQPGAAPYGNLPLTGGPSPNYRTTQNTINYLNGVATNVYFPVPIPSGADINAQAFFFQTGLPRAILFYNNVLTIRNPPDTQYLVEIDAYLSPAAFFNGANSIPFAYMSEYLSLGAARKFLSDIGDDVQLNFYEPRFREQEALVHIRSQRQFTASRTESLYSQGITLGTNGYNNQGGNV